MDEKLHLFDNHMHTQLAYCNDNMIVNKAISLAHPFRVFRRCGCTAPEELFLQAAVLLRKNDTAAEINFHTNEPPIEFIRICLNQGVRFSLGSDAHQMAEIGDFAYHLALLEEAGFDGDLTDILIPN
jgi:histidinol phosphatase-like PHP family hydrolase